jgi:C4-dicarboxylate transporter
MAVIPSAFLFAKEAVKFFLCCLGIRARLASGLGVFLGDTIFPISGGIGGIAKTPKDLIGN